MAHQAEQQAAVLGVGDGEAVGFNQVAQHAVVEIVAAERGIAAGGLHFKQAFGKLQNGYVEGTTAEVVHHKGAFGGIIQPIGDGGGGGLVEQAQHVQPGQTGGVFGGLALSIVKIGRHGDDRTHQLATKALFSTCFECAQDIGRYIDWRFRALAGLQVD